MSFFKSASCSFFFFLKNPLQLHVFGREVGHLPPSLPPSLPPHTPPPTTQQPTTNNQQPTTNNQQPTTQAFDPKSSFCESLWCLFHGRTSAGGHETPHALVVATRGAKRACGLRHCSPPQLQEEESGGPRGQGRWTRTVKSLYDPEDAGGLRAGALPAAPESQAALSRLSASTAPALVPRLGAVCHTGMEACHGNVRQRSLSGKKQFMLEEDKTVKIRSRSWWQDKSAFGSGWYPSRMVKRRMSVWHCASEIRGTPTSSGLFFEGARAFNDALPAAR